MHSLFPDVTGRILRAVDAQFESQVAFLQDLVRAPSQRGAEAGAQEFIAKALETRGYTVDRFGITPEMLASGHPAFSPATVDYAETFNVVGWHIPTRSAGRSRALNAHIDVVPPGDEAAGRIRPIWVRARGTGSMGVAPAT